ncbi:sugar transferase [Aureitalea sp. L0-47]|uniref:sugar transferase n=1 Tax=Aureitalea sp. L0-47 TaxID=2816962 RepID=UPI002237D038|nr:sugar transferase [Aureitalea sp. L0-47]MCW5520388.1 sugar transferase [Aureitalea sp. L0-47]
MYAKLIKPVFDLTIATLLFCGMTPIFLIIAILLFIFQGGSPFFLQIRPGKKEKLFTIVKFRTMNNKTDDKGELLSDKDRLTSIGKFIRTTSLDEIPQLLNVIKGDMSFVGPRPLLPEYLDLYNDEQKQRHLVRPGITGLAQVSGRNAISWAEKLTLDVEYVKNQSLLLDLKILLLTIKKIFKREGITSEGQATTTRFKGN